MLEKSNWNLVEMTLVLWSISITFHDQLLTWKLSKFFWKRKWHHICKISLFIYPSILHLWWSYFLFNCKLSEKPISRQGKKVLSGSNVNRRVWFFWNWHLWYAFNHEEINYFQIWLNLTFHDGFNLDHNNDVVKFYIK